MLPFLLGLLAFFLLLFCMFVRGLWGWTPGGVGQRWSLDCLVKSLCDFWKTEGVSLQASVLRDGCKLVWHMAVQSMYVSAAITFIFTAFSRVLGSLMGGGFFYFAWWGFCCLALFFYVRLSRYFVLNLWILWSWRWVPSQKIEVNFFLSVWLLATGWNGQFSSCSRHLAFLAALVGLYRPTFVLLKK